MAKCIVFGGNGFIGSHLVDALASAGHEVTCFDRFSEQDPTYTSKEVRQYAGDFMNKADVSTALEGQEYVFHLISTTNPATAENDPVFDVKTNISASVELFQACVNKGIKKIFFSSTGGAIYGDQAKHALNENDPTYPFSPYAIGKLTIENYLRYFKKKHNLDYTVFRISNPYGTRQHPHRKQGVIPIFLRNIVLGNPITIIGDGSMVRDYIYVGDVVDMIIATVGKDTKHMVYNLGSGKGETINEIIEVIEDVTSVHPLKEFTEMPKTYVQHVTLDISRYFEEFGVSPQVSLSEGIKLTWQEIKQQT